MKTSPHPFHDNNCEICTHETNDDDADEEEKDGEDKTTAMINDWRQGSWFDGDNNAALASPEATLRLSTSRTRAGKWLSHRQELFAPVTLVVHCVDAKLFVELLRAHTDDVNFSVDFERLTTSYIHAGPANTTSTSSA